MLERLDGHIVVCGGGRMGQQVMKELLALVHLQRRIS